MALFCLSAAHAGEPKNALLVLTKDNVKHLFMLDEKPEITFSGSELTVKSEKTTAAFSLSDVLRFTYQKEDEAGINELQADEVALDYVNGTLIISNLKAGESVGVFALDGKQVQKLTARRAGTFRISLSAIPSGVYIVKAGVTSYKITKP